MESRVTPVVSDWQWSEPYESVADFDLVPANPERSNTQLLTATGHPPQLQDIHE